jgi:hypothetical protein
MVNVRHNTLISINLCSIILSACTMKTPEPIYLGQYVQADYPSGSTISYLNGRFYVMGDDASEILVLDEFIREVARIPLFPKAETKRIPKASKADIESSVVLKHEGRDKILFVGSGSVSAVRDSAFLFDPKANSIQRIDYSHFFDQLRADFDHLNIEACAIVKEEMVLGVRATATYPDNYIVRASLDFLSPVIKSKLLIKLPLNNAGISGMDYDQDNDILFITFSSEDTQNAVDDGRIGDSYLAIILQASRQMKKKELAIPSLIKLADLSPDLREQKIESVSFTPVTNELLLVADDDMGNTTFFKLAL